MVIKLMDRFPVVITIGAMLLGWIAGTMAVTDPAIVGWLAGLTGQTAAGAAPEVSATIRYGAGVLGALLVLAAGKLMANRKPAA
jgi:predicted tellurium resistance membrane protein TerC